MRGVGKDYEIERAAAAAFPLNNVIQGRRNFWTPPRWARDGIRRHVDFDTDYVGELGRLLGCVGDETLNARLIGNRCARCNGPVPGLRLNRDLESGPLVRS